MRLATLAGPAAVLTVGLLPAFAHSMTAAATPGASSLLAWSGAGLIVASLLLMIREPAVASWFGGLERMYRWHHALGTIGYALALAHPLALSLALLPDVASAWRAIALAPGVPGSVLGWLGAFGLMLGLGTTFALRLPYAVWRRFHATLGIAVLLSVAHVYWVDGAGIGLLLLAIPVALGIGWRLLRADFGASARPYEVEAVTHPAPAMTEVTLKPLAEPIEARPGQFVMLAFFEGPHFHGCGEYHPFSVSRVEAAGRLSVVVKALGDCTRNVQQMTAGVAARVQGPFGTFMQDRPSAPQVWIAGGIGIAAFIAWIRADQVQHPTVLVYLFRGETDAAYVTELQAYAASHPTFRLHAHADGENPGMLRQLLASVELPQRVDAYLCGPPAMIQAARAILVQRGVAAAAIHSERFDFR